MAFLFNGWGVGGAYWTEFPRSGTYFISKERKFIRVFLFKAEQIAVSFASWVSRPPKRFKYPQRMIWDCWITGSAEQHGSGRVLSSPSSLVLLTI